MEEKTLHPDDIKKSRRHIEYLLLQLDPTVSPVDEILKKYTKWRAVSLIPIEELELAIKDLQSEHYAKNAIGDDMYQSSCKAADKIRIYENALVLLPAELAKDGQDLEDNITFAEFRKVLSDCVTKAAKIPREELAKSRKAKSDAKSKKKSLPKVRKSTQAMTFLPPTAEEVEAYCKEKNITNVNIKAFFGHYEATDWFLSTGKKMKAWKSAVQHWHHSKNEEQQKAADSGYIGRGHNAVELGARPRKDAMQGASEYKPLYPREE